MNACNKRECERILFVECVENERCHIPSTTRGLSMSVVFVAYVQDAAKEAQQIEINVSYPRRNFTLLGSYAVTDSSLFSEASLSWDKDRGSAIKPKSVEAAFDWQQISSAPNSQLFEFQIRHPSFERVSYIPFKYTLRSMAYFFCLSLFAERVL